MSTGSTSDRPPFREEPSDESVYEDMSWDDFRAFDQVFTDREKGLLFTLGAFGTSRAFFRRNPGCVCTSVRLTLGLFTSKEDMRAMADLAETCEVYFNSIPDLTSSEFVEVSFVKEISADKIDWLLVGGGVGQ